VVSKIYRRPPSEISAGYFEDRPWIDRLNPLTPFHSKRFVPSPEAKKILDDFSKETGKKVNVFPLPHEREELGPIDENTLGLYVSDDYRGGSLDPFSRNVYLSEKFNKPGLFTLAHELGHARDRSMWKTPLQRFARAVGFDTNNNLRDADFSTPGNWRSAVHQVQSPQILEIFKDEIEAEDYAKKVYNKYGLSDETSRTNLFDYPASYISNFHNSFVTPADARNEFKTGVDDGTFNNYDFTAENNKRLLDIGFEVAADENYQKDKRNLIKKALEYAENFNMRPPEGATSSVLSDWYNK
tara:strand:- start:220 stop:1113 length:894 start_codon:yes stop_codon:yes gene_type:complete